MTADLELTKRRFIELGRKSFNSGIFTFTDFLGLAEQSVFDAARQEFRHVKYESFGGSLGTERIMVRFGDTE